MAQKLQAPRGMNDVLPSETPFWRQFMESVQGVMDAYGYREIRLPVVEFTELFKRTVGEATDIVEKEMFTFLDREKTSLSLRPEGTAGCVRAGINHGLLHNQIQRFWYHGPMFRHERPQAGRYRQFHQVGVEAFGMTGATIDIEVIALSARLWKQLGIQGLSLELNSLGTLEERGQYRTALVKYLQGYVSQMDEDSKRRLVTNPLRVLDSKDPGTREVLKSAPVLADSLGEESRVHFDAVQQGLRDLGIESVLNPKLVRGLDYYTRTVFEWTTSKLGAQGTVCAGGRYDGLVNQLGGGDVPAFGFALGIERLILLMQEQGILVPDIAPQVYLCWLAEEGRLLKQRKLALQLAEQLRDSGFRVLMDAAGAQISAGADIDKQLKRADKSGAAVALILGEEETARRAVQVKSLRVAHPGSTPPAECTWTELPSRLSGLLGLMKH